jgi:4a-hydroxytetrahydrobiopterin dehydratase
MERRKLDQNEIESTLMTLDGWSLDEGQIVKEFTFDTYKAGLVFAAAVGHFADRMDHHPDMYIGYQKVEVAMNTHDLDGISTYDMELARLIETLV